MRKEVLLVKKSRIGNILLEHGLEEERGRGSRKELDPILLGSRIHERTISLMFLGIILRVLRLGVSVWIS
jgi:hypothetical protein